MVFGMPRALFPAIGIDVFHGGARTVGLLYAAPGAGALVGAITTGWVSRIRRQGRAVIVAVVIWGAAITAFGLVAALWLALVLLAIAGWADVVSAVFRNTILQIAVPDRLRGRLSAVQIAVVQGGPRLGDLESGAVAELSSVTLSVVSGGIACMAGAFVLAALLPGFRTQQAGGSRSPRRPPAPSRPRSGRAVAGPVTGSEDLAAWSGLGWRGGFRALAPRVRQCGDRFRGDRGNGGSGRCRGPTAAPAVQVGAAAYRGGSGGDRRLASHPVVAGPGQ